MSNYLEYIGNYTILLPTFSIFFLILFFISWYCKKNGPNSSMTAIAFYAPMVASLLLGILLFYTPHFWISLVFYSILFIAINMASFKALEHAIEDKTGLGITMFTGLVGMFFLFFSVILRFILQ